MSTVYDDEEVIPIKMSFLEFNISEQKGESLLLNGVSLGLSNLVFKVYVLFKLL